MATSTLNAIRLKIRRITRTPSPDQLTDTNIDEYVNTFIQYDFPEHLRLFSLHKTLTFYTTPFIDTYSTVTVGSSNPLYNFKNKIITVNDPVYVAGYKALFTQSREQLFNIYPFMNNISTVGTGDGVSTVFVGTMPNAPLLRNNVTFSSSDTNNNQIALRDVPFDNLSGNLVAPNLPTPPFLDPNNSINYITGAYTATFSVAPGASEDIVAEVVPYVASRPLALLFYDDTFTVRPVPDKVYPVNIEVYVRPTELLAAGQSPDLEQWWQYIALGAAKKVFEDRSDYDSVQQIMPEYKQQELLVLRKTIVQQANERVSTIYTENVANQMGAGWFYGGGPY